MMTTVHTASYFIIKRLCEASHDTRNEVLQLLFEDMLTKSYCGKDVILVSTIINMITDGGFLLADDLNELEVEIARSNMWEGQKPLKTSHITKKSGYNPLDKKAYTISVQIVKYKPKHMPILLTLCDNWVNKNSHKIIYN